MVVIVDASVDELAGGIGGVVSLPAEKRFLPVFGRDLRVVLHVGELNGDEAQSINVLVKQRCRTIRFPASTPPGVVSLGTGIGMTTRRDPSFSGLLAPASVAETTNGLPSRSRSNSMVSPGAAEKQILQAVRNVARPGQRH